MGWENEISDDVGNLKNGTMIRDSLLYEVVPSERLLKVVLSQEHGPGTQSGPGLIKIRWEIPILPTLASHTATHSPSQLALDARHREKTNWK